MPLLVFLICVLALLADLGTARASDDEFRQKRALFVLENFLHWTDAKYQYQGRSTNGDAGSSASHQLYENYNAQLGFDILNPHLFTANLGVTLGLNQSWFGNQGQGTTSGNSIKYNYQFTGSGLDRSVTPFSISSYKNTETVITPFAPSFTSSTTGNEVSVSLMNGFLPSVFNFARRSVDNSGGGIDSTSSSDSFGYSATHTVGTFSTTALTLTVNQTSSSALGQQQTGRSYSAAASNSLQWGTEGKYSLSSQAQIYQSMQQEVPERSVGFSEVFHDQLGKALDLQATYAFADSSTVSSAIGAADVRSKNTSNTAEIQLSHHLFESLTTRLKGKYTFNELAGGQETRTLGSGELTYTKKLPGNNHLTLGFTGVHEIIDNRLGTPVNVIVNQLHPNVQPGDVITLQLTGLLTGAVVVHSTTPLFTYAEGQDYTLQTDLGQITILVGGRIRAGTDLLIDYNDYNNTDLKYASDAVKTNGAITFASGKYVLGYSYTNQWMTLIRGSEQNSLRDSNLKMLYFSGNVDPLSYRVTLTDLTIGNQGSTSLEGYAQYIRDSMWGRLSFVGTERVNRYYATGTTPAFTEAATSFNVSALRTFFSCLRTTVAANAYDSRSDQRSPKDIFSLRASLLFVLNKFTATFDGQTAWTFSGGSTTRDDTVTLDLLRYF